MRELPVIACSLDAAGQAARADEFRALLVHATECERLPDGARIVLPADRADEARELLEKEQECCSFWGFRMTEDGDKVVIEARAPAEAAPLVERLFSV